MNPADKHKMLDVWYDDAGLTWLAKPAMLNLDETHYRWLNVMGQLEIWMKRWKSLDIHKHLTFP